MARRLVVEEARSSERPEVNFSGPRTSVGGEDAIFVRDAVARGHRTYYVATACVRPIVRRAQVDIRPASHRYLRHGRQIPPPDPDQFAPRGPHSFGSRSKE